MVDDVDQRVLRCCAHLIVVGHKLQDAVKDSIFGVLLGVDSQPEQLQCEQRNHCAHQYGQQVVQQVVQQILGCREVLHCYQQCSLVSCQMQWAWEVTLAAVVGRSGQWAFRIGFLC